MNILFLTRLYWPHVGGVEKHVEKVSLELIKLGHEVTVITEQYDKKLKQVARHKGIKVYRIPVWKISEKAKKWYVWKWLWQHQDLISQTDILHIHDVFFWCLPFKLLRLNKKVFITFHGYETKFPISKSAIFHRRLAAKLTSANICVGDYISKWYGIKPDIITYGATDQKKLALPKKPAILILGRPSSDNNINQVRAALRQSGPVTLASDLKTASLVIASSYLSIWEGLAAGRPVLSIYTNPLKQDYLKPLSKYIHIANSTSQLIHLIRKYTLAVYPKKAWENLPTWDKITQQYLLLWHQQTTVPST